MIVTCIVVPPLFADRRVDLVRALFFCFAFACVLSIFFVVNGEPEMARYGEEWVNIGYPGYFLGKNYLGECATLALLLSLHEMLHPGLRRALGVVIAALSIFLVSAADSKTALGLAIVTPCLAGLTLFAAKKTRLSPAIILLLIPLLYTLLSSISNFNINRLSYTIYGDATLTGRTLIWDFASSEIARRPLFGWGYQSFWLVGPDAPSIIDAPGWIKMMPNAHNGYYDATLEMGYVGYYLCLIFIVATLHAIGRVAYRDVARAWLLLSLALYIICFNYLETLWMRGFEFLWVVLLIVAAEIGRYWQPLSQKTLRAQSGPVVPLGPRPLQIAGRSATKQFGLGVSKIGRGFPSEP
jgi:O-antigen ligase